ncbi:MAG: TIGR02147 family protein [Deltaproteobacteria bacterium]|nr:TIGR02147 family protein [Deltaproteobacteria bacterium]
MPHVYEYLDYRCFLKERIEELRRNGRFSFRNFNRKAGFRSSGTLKLVIDGKRNLATQGIYRVVKGLKLTSAEAKFFNSLVMMNQAGTHEEKDHYFRELAASRPFRKAKELTALQYDCFSHWYHVAILELTRTVDFQENPEWISNRLKPAVSPAEIKKAMTDLERLHFLKRGTDGRLCPAAITFSTPDEVHSLSITNFHRQMCDLAKQSVADIHPELREFSSLTIATSEEGLKKIKSKIQAFKKELDACLEDLSPKNQVIQINLQAFPLTKEPL